MKKTTKADERTGRADNSQDQPLGNGMRDGGNAKVNADMLQITQSFLLDLVRSGLAESKDNPMNIKEAVAGIQGQLFSISMDLSEKKRVGQEKVAVDDGVQVEGGEVDASNVQVREKVAVDAGVQVIAEKQTSSVRQIIASETVGQEGPISPRSKWELLKRAYHSGHWNINAQEFASREQAARRRFGQAHRDKTTSAEETTQKVAEQPRRDKEAFVKARKHVDAPSAAASKASESAHDHNNASSRSDKASLGKTNDTGTHSNIGTQDVGEKAPQTEPAISAKPKFRISRPLLNKPSLNTSSTTSKTTITEGIAGSSVGKKVIAPNGPGIIKSPTISGVLPTPNKDTNTDKVKPADDYLFNSQPSQTTDLRKRKTSNHTLQKNSVKRTRMIPPIVQDSSSEFDPSDSTDDDYSEGDNPNLKRKAMKLYEKVNTERKQKVVTKPVDQVPKKKTSVAKEPGRKVAVKKSEKSITASAQKGGKVPALLAEGSKPRIYNPDLGFEAELSDEADIYSPKLFKSPVVRSSTVRLLSVSPDSSECGASPRAWTRLLDRQRRPYGPNALLQHRQQLQHSNYQAPYVEDYENEAEALRQQEKFYEMNGQGPGMYGSGYGG